MKDDLTTNAQSTLFALPDAKPLLGAGLTCTSHFVTLSKKFSLLACTHDLGQLLDLLQNTSY